MAMSLIAIVRMARVRPHTGHVRRQEKGSRTCGERTTGGLEAQELEPQWDVSTRPVRTHLKAGEIMPRNSSMKAVLVSLVVLAISACGSVREATTAFSGEGRSSASSSTPTTKPELGGLISATDQRFLILAEETLVSRCMKDEGFDYQVVAPPSDWNADSDGPNRPYGSDDVESLRAEGYGFEMQNDDAAPQSETGPDSTGSGRTDPNREYVQALSPAEQDRFSVALFGRDSTEREVEIPGARTLSINTEGCLHEARERLYGDALEWLRLFYMVENAQSEVVARVIQDERYQAALSDWRECMKDKGFDFDDPGEARAEAVAAHRNLERAGARERERSIAGADGSCVRQSSLVETGTDLESEYLEQVLAEREGEIIAYRQILEDAVHQAKELIRG